MDTHGNNDGGGSLEHLDTAPPPPPPPLAPPPPPRRARSAVGRRGATAALAGGLVIGGIAGGYVISQAATSAPSASATPAPGAAPADPGRPGFGGPAAMSEDLQQAATAIGITTAQLQAELTAGKTIAAVAKAHNVDTATVISTLVADENAEIDAAATAGRITAAQATQMKTQTTQRVTDMVNGVRPAFGPGGPGGHGGGPGGQAEDQQVVATALGITTAQLQAETAAGKTIAAIAKAHSVDPNAVISALVASENKEIDARVAAGQMTAAEAAQAKAGTTQRVTAEVNGTQPTGGFGGHGGPPFGGPGTGGPST